MNHDDGGGTAERRRVESPFMTLSNLIKAIVSQMISSVQLYFDTVCFLHFSTSFT